MLPRARGRRWMLLLLLLLLLLPSVLITTMVVASSAVHPDVAPSASFFTVITELYGNSGTTAHARFAQNLATGVDFHATLTASDRAFLAQARPPFVYYSVPRSANVSGCYPGSIDGNASALLRALANELGHSHLWRLALPEFDQGGGCWADGRPSARGVGDAQAHRQWVDYYMQTRGLAAPLSQPLSQRGQWLAICDFGFCPQYAFEMGVDAVLIECNEDEMPGITPKLAMLRGAASQFGGKTWGVDFSTYRYWNGGPTVYRQATSGFARLPQEQQLVTGWSHSTVSRNYHIAFATGAHIAHSEAAVYCTDGGDHAGPCALNPLGRAIAEFVNFTLRHPERGQPCVPLAFLQSHFSGFEPKFGAWMQGDAKWCVLQSTCMHPPPPFCVCVCVCVHARACAFVSMSLAACVFVSLCVSMC